LLDSWPSKPRLISRMRRRPQRKSRKAILTIVPIFRAIDSILPVIEKYD
jgi:hypothetical protein